MEKKELVLENVSMGLEEMKGARRATGISSSNRTNGPVIIPDPEVQEKAFRRRFTADYKRRILREAEACKDSGKIGALLRREGLYSSNLVTWRRQAEQGTLAALSPKKRGPKEKKPNPLVRRIAELERETQKLQHQLRQAELIIAAQKKIAELFQPPLDPQKGVN